MKKCLAVLFVLFEPFLFSIAQDEDVSRVPMINKAGEVMMQQKSDWRPLNQEEKEAFKNPGQEVLVGCGSISFERAGFWYYSFLRTCDKAIIFKDGKIHTITKNSVVKSERILRLWSVFALTAIFFMIVSNRLFMKRKKYVFTSYLAITLVLYSIIFYAKMAIIYNTAVPFATVGVLFIFLFSTCFCVYPDDKKSYFISSAVFYLFAAVLFVF
jgi:hypothetical protein